MENTPPEIELLPDFEDQRPYLIGSPRQFYANQGDIFCLRATCDDCPHFNDGCEHEEEKIQVDIIPHARRGIGTELIPFLILRLKKDLNFTVDVPEDLWNHDRDPFSLDERNLHFLLSDQKHKFRVMKGQFRYYGSKEEFDASPYAEYFDYWDEFIPQHYVVAIDYSAIEPRVTTLASREPLYVEVFKGVPRPVVREVEIDDS